MSKCEINKKNRKVKKTKQRDYPKLDVATVEECMSTYTIVKNAKSGKPSLKDTEAYKKLSPFGTYQTNTGKYNYGNKSYLKKKELCLVLMNPKMYFKKNKKECKKDKKYHEKRPNEKKNRVRQSRKGMCPNKRKTDVNDNCPGTDESFKFKGLTTTGKDCCYKKKMSRKVLNRRRTD